MDIEPQIKVINDFLEERIEHFNVTVESFEQRRTPREVFDQVFRETLRQLDP